MAMRSLSEIAGVEGTGVGVRPELVESELQASSDKARAEITSSSRGPGRVSIGLSIMILLLFKNVASSLRLCTGQHFRLKVSA
jgi:hypothetical protein